MTGRAANVSVLILTFNEEAVLRKCLDSVRWSDDVVVLDSYSTDGTESIARQYQNVRFLQRRFDDFATQRNFGLHNTEFRNNWCLTLDADEACNADLEREVLRTAAAADDSVALFSIRRRESFCGRWIRHSSSSPGWVQRLTRPARVRYERGVHEVLLCDGGHGFLKGYIDHYVLAKGLSFWFERHNRFSDMEAEIELRRRRPFIARDLLNQNPVRQKEALKCLSERLPGRWMHFLLYNVFVKGCFLDGVHGMHYVLIKTCQRYMVDAKIWYRRNSSTCDRETTSGS